jgi:hypothetical protein
MNNKINEFLFGYRVDGIGGISTPTYGIPKWRIFENRRIDKKLREDELVYLHSDAYARECVKRYFSSMARTRKRNEAGQFVK